MVVCLIVFFFSFSLFILLSSIYSSNARWTPGGRLKTSCDRTRSVPVKKWVINKPGLIMHRERWGRGGAPGLWGSHCAFKRASIFSSFAFFFFDTVAWSVSLSLTHTFSFPSVLRMVKRRPSSCRETAFDVKKMEEYILMGSAAMACLTAPTLRRNLTSPCCREIPLLADSSSTTSPG